MDTVSEGIGGFYKAIGGLEGRGAFIVVAGRPGMGKTCLALQMSRFMAGEGKKVIVFSLEPDGFGIADILIAQGQGPVADVYGPETRQAEKIAEIIMAGGNTGAAVIDFIQLAETDGGVRYGERDRKTKSIIEVLKSSANASGVPVLVCSQLPRKVDGRKSRVPVLSDLDRFAGLRKSADAVIFPFRPAYYETYSSGDRDGDMLILAENRYGSKGTFPVRWDGKRLMFMK